MSFEIFQKCLHSYTALRNSGYTDSNLVVTWRTIYERWRQEPEFPPQRHHFYQQ
jgi:hypothetical protein